MAARSWAVVRGQSVVSKARRAAAMACWTWASVATSTSVTIVPSLGLTTGLQVPSPDATHSPSMNRLGTGSLKLARLPSERPRMGLAPYPSQGTLRHAASGVGSPDA
jgi:hypothetical protein